MDQHNYEDQEPTDTPITVPTAFQVSCDHALHPECTQNLMATQCNQYPNLSHNSALPQFLAHHNCENLDPTENPNAVPTALQAPSDDTYNTMCAHNPMETQRNQSQYPILMKQNCTHNPSTSQIKKSYHSNPVTFPYPPDPGEHVLERSATPTVLVERDKLDLSSLAPPKGEMESSFSWTYPFKSPTSSALCFFEPTLRKLAQVKLMCNPISHTLCDFTLGKLNQETEFYITKHMPKSSSGTNRVWVNHSSLVTTSSSRWILEKPMIEVTKTLIHHIGKNREHFYWENFIHEYPKSWRHTKSNQNIGTNHGPNYTSNGCTLKEFDWGDKLKLNYTSYGCMLMEIDWGGKFNCTSCGCPMANWQGHGTHPTGHNTSEVDWGGHDTNPNHMNESLLSEVDWGAHDSSVFLFLVNIDYDAKPNESSIQELLGELQHRTSSIPLIGLQIDSLATGQTGDDIFSSTPINPDLDDPEQLTGESIQYILTLVIQLQWLVVLGRLVTHAQITTLPKLMVA